MHVLSLDLDELELYAGQLREMAPTLRSEAANLPAHLDGSSALSSRYAELMRTFGAGYESLANEIEDFTQFARTAASSTAPDGQA